ncbi:MAG: hypothetical protein II645_07310 [Bacteroidaceae bacterium]|nr:hypothetical protein [Bacteroidaceae bacterium]
MKKFFKKSIVLLCLLGTGVGMTSCDEETISQIIQLLGVVLNGNDQTYIYSGTANISMYNYNSDNNTYDQESKVEKNFQMSPSITIFTADSVVTVALGEMSFGNTTIKDFTFNTYYANGKIDPDGPNYLTGGTCTFNGTQNTAINSAAIQGTITSGESSKLNLTKIEFQVGDKYFIGTFSGTNATQSNN